MTSSTSYLKDLLLLPIGFHSAIGWDLFFWHVCVKLSFIFHVRPTLMLLLIFFLGNSTCMVVRNDNSFKKLSKSTGLYSEMRRIRMHSWSWSPLFRAPRNSSLWSISSRAMTAVMSTAWGCPMARPFTVVGFEWVTFSAYFTHTYSYSLIHIYFVITSYKNVGRLGRSWISSYSTFDYLNKTSVELNYLEFNRIAKICSVNRKLLYKTYV